MAILLGAVFSANAQAALQAPAAACEAALAAAIQSDMTLSEPDFDQAEHTGFRALARKGCQAEAGVLALAYLGRNPGTSPNVWWHAAQMFAGAGRMAVADALATFALSGRETDATPFRWNDYVLASKAYFARDPDQFALYTTKVRQKVACQVGNAINLNMLEALQASWDAGYDTAGARGRHPGRQGASADGGLPATGVSGPAAGPIHACRARAHAVRSGLAAGLRTTHPGH